MGYDDLDDPDLWEDMPVILPTSSTELDIEDRKRYHYNPSISSHLRSSETSTSSAIGGASSGGVGNATGKLLDFDYAGQEWREKEKLDEMDYTRLELDDDPEEDEISMRTQYLFNEEKGMTPLSQMQATKTLLTEGQRIAYVGLCRLVAREMVQVLSIAAKGAKELDDAKESAHNWANKIMGRLYRHMEVDSAEQRMIELLAEHGVTAEDLVPSLVTTHTVDNPEYDPDVAAEVEATAALKASAKAEAEKQGMEVEPSLSPSSPREEVTQLPSISNLRLSDPPIPPQPPSPSLDERSPPSFDDAWDDGGDIGGALDVLSTPKGKNHNDTTFTTSQSESPKSPSDVGDIPSTPKPHPYQPDPLPPPLYPSQEGSNATGVVSETAESSPAMPQSDHFLGALPSSLPGVSKSLTAADKTITLDIRWTILCDLFLSLIADSVYDARSRVLLGKMAERLGLEWMDVVRFERRLTEALDIQENVQQKEHLEVLENQRKKGKRQRYLMMGLATLGGGLVIGLSAGLLAPVIGAGLGAAFTTVGVTGTTGFLAGTGGAAIVTSGGIVVGSATGGRAMAKRTLHVRTFEFQPLHNNKRVNFFITVPGFMNGPLDDVRLPFSTIDPVMGDVFSVLWEPEMMGDTGNALKILTSEVLTQVGQQVLAMTVMTALLSALQWPMMLTKLGYLIDNPWSNALDRARQAGAVLADILLNRRLGVRPVSLVGFSLGARVIFYALVELAKAKAFGVVQEVYLFGATLTASNKVWRQVRGLVAGRFVNAFAMNDWVLGYLFRATSGGLNTVAGLRPIDHVPDLENVDITHILVGHMSYRTLMPTLLAHVGFKTTADHFDEPEDMGQDSPDREVLTKEEEEKRNKEREEKTKGVLAIFKKKSKTSSAPMSRNPSGEYDMPPRLSTGSSSALSKTSDERSRSSLSVSSHHTDEASDKGPSGEVSDKSSSGNIDEVESPQTQSADSSPNIPSESVGFDLAKIREEVAQLPKVEDNRGSSTPHLPLSGSAEDVLRTSSAPPQIVTKNDETATLDPREILRRQWAGEAVRTPGGETILNIPWEPAPNPFELPFGDGPSIARPSPLGSSTNGVLPAPPALAFTFGSSTGDLSWQEDQTAKDSSPNDTPDPASTFVWGQPNASTTSFRNQNPWVVGTLTLISFLGYSSQIFILLPSYDWVLSSESLQALVPFNILLILLFYNYLLCLVSDPGVVPKGWEHELEKSSVEEVGSKSLKRQSRFCKTCQVFKPPRSHHCRTCKRCVMRMDHHCPWVNNCVGFANYGHFIRFLFFVDITCAFHLLLITKRAFGAAAFASEPTTTQIIMLILNYTASVPVMILVGAFSLYHFWCLATNTTTIEGWEKDKVARLKRKGKVRDYHYPYNLGVLDNIRSVLGRSPLFWCIPQKMTGDGLKYKVAKGLEEEDQYKWPPRDEFSERARRADRVDRRESSAINAGSAFTYGSGLNPNLAPNNSSLSRRRAPRGDGHALSIGSNLQNQDDMLGEYEYGDPIEFDDNDYDDEDDLPLSTIAARHAMRTGDSAVLEGEEDPDFVSSSVRIRRGSEGYEVRPMMVPGKPSFQSWEEWDHETHEEGEIDDEGDILRNGPRYRVYEAENSNSSSSISSNGSDSMDDYIDDY